MRIPATLLLAAGLTVALVPAAALAADPAAQVNLANPLARAGERRAGMAIRPATASQGARRTRAWSANRRHQPRGWSW